MKKIFVFMLGFVLIFGLVACGNSNSDNTAGSEGLTEEYTEAESGKTLVVYYSATGNTKEAPDLKIPVNCSRKWQVPENGWKASVSVPVFRKVTFRIGYLSWACKLSVVLKGVA